MKTIYCFFAASCYWPDEDISKKLDRLALLFKPCIL